MTKGPTGTCSLSSLVDEVLDTVRRLKEEGITLLVEQNVREALDLADRGYILQTGRITCEWGQ